MRKKRILVVDDESGFIRLLKLGLEKKAQYLVRQENDSTRALETAGRFKPDLVLLDFVMPKSHGGDVAARIRADARFRNTPILFLSGTVVKGRDAPPQLAGYEALSKPIGLDDLVAAIERNLEAAKQLAPKKSGWFTRIGETLQRIGGKSVQK